MLPFATAPCAVLGERKLSIMRSRTSLLAGALALAGILFTVRAAADDGADRSVIVTRGTGEVRARPDSVRVEVGTDAQAPTLDQAREQVSGAVTRVVTALRGLGIADLTLETEDLRFNPVYAAPKEGEAPSIVGYAASNRVLVTTKHAMDADLSTRAARIVDAALAAGANEIGGLDFFLADSTSAENQALTLAVQNAARDADIMARAAHVTITGPVFLEEASAARVPRALTMAAPLASTPVEVGDIVIQSSVTAKFGFR
jgi:uncharacterized protein YggE